MMTGEDYFYISSQLVREVASFGGDVTGPGARQRAREAAGEVRPAVLSRALARDERSSAGTDHTV